MIYSGAQGASGATTPTDWFVAQGFGGNPGVYVSNGSSLTIDGVGYWQFDTVGTTSTGNYFLLDTPGQFINGVGAGATYTVTYNYSLPATYAAVGAIVAQILWFAADNTLLTSTIQFSGVFTTWNRASTLTKSSFSAVAPLNAAKARVRFNYYNPHSIGTAINYTGYRIGGVQFNIGNTATSYVATTTTPSIPSLTWKDVSGYQNHANVVGLPVHSPSGHFTFNGANTYATINSTASLTTATPTIIVVCTTASSGTPMAKGQYGSHWNYGLNGPASTNFRLRNNDGDTVSATYGTISGMNIFAGVWDGTNVNFYLNGNFIGQSTQFYSPVANNTEFLTIGCALNPGAVPTEYYAGNIAMVQVYNRPLSATEIKQHYNGYIARFGTQIVIDSSLKLWLDAGNSASYPGSGSTWTDISGTGNSGTVQSGATYDAAGWFNFDGTTGNVSLPNTPTGFSYGNAPGTICGWARTTSTGIGYRFIFSYGSGGTALARFIGILNTSYLIGGGNVSPDLTSFGVTANRWFHIAQVYDGNVAYLYINGILVISRGREWNTIAGNAEVGRLITTSPWNGSIAEIQVYNRALIANEIGLNFNATRARYGI
jgi:hypothetical protein